MRGRGAPKSTALAAFTQDICRGPQTVQTSRKKAGVKQKFQWLPPLCKNILSH